MDRESQTPSRKAGTELMPFVALGVTVLLATFGQAAWLDGKIERLDAKLSGEIHSLDAKLSREIRNLDAKLSGEIQNLDAKLSREIRNLDAKLSGEIQNLDAKLSGEIQRVESRLNIGLQNHQVGLSEVRERLAALESRVTSLERQAAG